MEYDVPWKNSTSINIISTNTAALFMTIPVIVNDPSKVTRIIDGQPLKDCRCINNIFFKNMEVQHSEISKYFFHNQGIIDQYVKRQQYGCSNVA